MKRRAFIGSLVAARSSRGRRAGRRADTEVPVPPELDALRRARAVLCRARQGLLPRGRPRSRDPGGQRLHHRRAARRQRHQPGRLRRRGDHDARRRRRHADQGGRRDAAAKPDGVHLPRRRGAPDQDLRDQGQPHRDHRRRREPRHLHRLHGQARHEARGRADDHRGEPRGEGAGGAHQAGRRAARLLHGPGPAHAAADRREDGLDAALRHGGRDHALERHHRQQRLAQGREEPGCAAALPARLAARLGVQQQEPRRGRRDLPQSRAGIHAGDRSARSRRHHDHHPYRAHQGQADRLVARGRLEGQPGPAGEVREAEAAAPMSASTTPTATFPSRRTCRRSNGGRALHPAQRRRQGLRIPRRGGRGLRRGHAGYPPLGVRRHRRPERLRQDHAAEDGGGAGAVYRGRDHRRRRARGAAADRRRHRVPGVHPARLARCPRPTSFSRWTFAAWTARPTSRSRAIS